MKKTGIRSILILTILLVIMAAGCTFAAGISSKSLTLTVGESSRLRVSTDKKITWKSSKKTVAAVSKKGVVKAKKAGSCKITAKAGKKSYTCKVKVIKKGIEGSSGHTAATAVRKTFSVPTAQMDAREKSICQKMLAQRASFPEGMTWTNSNYYAWHGGIYAGGYGCAGFAFCLSDVAFGDAPAMKHRDLSRIRVGDLLRVDNDSHMVIVLAVTSSELIVAEGNYGGTIHWGRTIGAAELRSIVDYVITRYT